MSYFKKVVTSWNQFAVNVKEAINLYVTEKQVAIAF